MSGDSTLYTIGTALNRARDKDIGVEILVEGQWVSGQVVAVDGFGVILSSEDHQHSVIRIERVAAVKVGTPAPVRKTIAAPPRPMPGPRHSHE